ncbi:Exopolysaccharide phosphotransferase [Forsythia ovata]|uniref:Exopolysaccharide phosphotransferase n=1 Tax=Forsythia ovata TaxID=205694 RepID=A0ABD1PXU5_9LAMI
MTETEGFRFLTNCGKREVGEEKIVEGAISIRKVDTRFMLLDQGRGSKRLDLPALVTLKDLRPGLLSPKKLRKTCYVKVKNEEYKDGARVYWKLVQDEDEDDDLSQEIPFIAIFEFIKDHIFHPVGQWTDSVLERKCVVQDDLPTLVTLKDLRPGLLSPRKLRKTRYVKVKNEEYKDGARVYWKLGQDEDEDDDLSQEIPFTAIFEFIKDHIFHPVGQWTDRLFGPLFGMPKHI